MAFGQNGVIPKQHLVKHLKWEQWVEPTYKVAIRQLFLGFLAFQNCKQIWSSPARTGIWSCDQLVYIGNLSWLNLTFGHGSLSLLPFPPPKASLLGTTCIVASTSLRAFLGEGKRK